MYTYKFYLLIVYLVSFRWTYCTEEPAAQTKTNVTFDLNKLNEHGSLSEDVDYMNNKDSTFTTPEGKQVEKVVYDNVDVWVSSADGNKTLKKLVATHKNNLLQLVHLVLVNPTSSPTQEENVYYKKSKGQFNKVVQTDYESAKSELKKKSAHHVDEWYPVDLSKKEVYSPCSKEQRDLEDGVWKRTVQPLNGKVYVVRDGNKELWTHTDDAKKFSSVQVLDFGNNNYLLTVFVTNDPKRFFKAGENATWESLDVESSFVTKATAFKSNYFSTKVEHDLSVKPNLTHFHVRRNKGRGNYNEVYLYPYRSYYLAHVKFKDTTLWTSEKDGRALYLKMNLLDYEVRTMQVIYAKNSTSPFPDKKAAYFYKHSDGTFKQADTRTEFTKHFNNMEASVDLSSKFVYRDDWVTGPRTLDLSAVNLEDFTSVTKDLTNGVSEQTLTPKEGVAFNKLSYREVSLWPTDQNPATSPNVTKVVLVSKDSLLQFVHMTGTKTDGAASGSTVDVNLYFKKAENQFTSVEPATTFEELKTKLVSGQHTVDKQFDLDVNQETLDEKHFTVTNEYVDGVDKRVVTVKDLKVTRLYSYRSDLWLLNSQQPTVSLMKYELYSYDTKTLLDLHFGTQGTASSHEYHEKRDPSVSWTKFTGNFNEKLLSYKSPDTWTALELDVSVAPSLKNYNVDVKPLTGNRTKLTLTPVRGKKVTSVKQGTTKTFFTTSEKNRVYKVELHLENYEAKFLKLYVWKDAADHNPQLTEQKFHKLENAWTETGYDEKVRTFESEASTVLFTYNPSWQLPPAKFDPKSFDKNYFESRDETALLVKTTTYTPKAGALVKQVFLDGAKVWPDGDQPDATKRLVSFKVLSKNDMVQLLHLQNALDQTPNTTEDLYYKKVTDTYEKLENLEKFNELKKTLEQEGTYVDDKVKLDLSAPKEASTKLFDTETTLEDGLEKTVVVVKVGKLYEVSASPPLWKSTDGSHVTKLERYTLDGNQLLVLHVTNPQGQTEKKYFEKPVPVPEPPAAPPEGPPASPPLEPSPSSEPRVEQQQQEQVQEVPQQPQESAKPSFTPLDGKTTFFDKLNKAKAAVTHNPVSLNLSAYQDRTKFDLKETTEGTTTLFKVYPKKTYWVTSLVNGSTNLWEKKVDGERLVEAFLYLHDTKVKFVRAVVWGKDHTDESKDQLLHFELVGTEYQTRDKNVFETALTKLTTVPPTPLSTETVPSPEPTPYEFHKFFLSDRYDTDLFDLFERTKGEYKLKNFTPKQDTFVNLVETQHGVLWKADYDDDYMKSSFFAVKSDSALAHLTLSVNSQPVHLFFKFENEKWHKLDSTTYINLYTKANLTSASN